MTQIEWTHLPGFKGETWNPIVGCSIVSKGCTNCYAMKQAARILRMTGEHSHYAGTVKDSKGGPVWTGKTAQAGENTLTAPLRARRPRCYFVNSMGDLFAENVPDAWIDQAFAVMALCPEHRFIVLTKRPDRMNAYLQRSCGRIADIVMQLRKTPEARRKGFGPSAVAPLPHITPGRAWWPLPNVWLGVSVEDQASADERIPLLLDTPAAVRLISAEPLLGRINLRHFVLGLQWVVVGGESGRDARPMHPDWARSLRDQCAAAGVPFFLKQWGEWAPPCVMGFDEKPQLTFGRKAVSRPELIHIFPDGVNMGRIGKKNAGHLLDGVEHFNWPADPAEARA